MHRFKTKHSAISGILRNSLPKKTVLRNYSLHNIWGITLMKNMQSCCRADFLTTPSCSLFCSSTAKKFISNRSRKLKELLTAPDGREKNEEIPDDMLFGDLGDLPLKTLDIADQKEKGCILKEENLEVFKEIADGDDKIVEQLRNLQINLDVTSCLYGLKINLTKEEWLEFLSVTPNQKKNFVAYTIVNTIRNIKRKYESVSPLYDLPFKDDEDEISSKYFDDVQCYHLFHNAMFLKLRHNAIKKQYYSKGFTAMLYSPHLVFDCSYQDFMSILEIKELGKQLIASTTVNIKSEQPFHITFCNFNQNDKLGKYLKKLNPIIYSDEYPITITEKSYLDIFPKTDLVYLTPHCNSSLKYFDPHKIYIVGGFIDKTQKKPVSLAKAKEQGLSMAKFPIDEFLDWGLGNKCLTLPHVTKIMIDLKTYNGNWNIAFQNIPKRCLYKNKLTSKTKNTFENEIKTLFDSDTYKLY